MSILHENRPSSPAARSQPTARPPLGDVNVGDVERWASTIGGTLLVAHGLRRQSFGGLALALIGGGLVYRGFTGHCEAYKALDIDTVGKHRSDADEHIHKGVLVKHTVTVNRPADELYRYWREVENAPRFMTNIRSANRIEGGRSHWVSSGPLGKTFEWDSEIINDQPGRLIAWKSLPGGDVDQAGSVRFEPASGGRGTVVTIEVNYEPPAGVLGIAVAKILGEDPDGQVRENLRHFKQLMEAGEIPTTAGQSSGREGHRTPAVS